MNCRHCQYSIAGNERWCPNCGKFVPESLIGQVLGDKYELLEVLGMGGMGAVYRARRKRIEDEVVVKTLLPSLSQESARFHREAQASASVKHSNVVIIHDSDEARGELPAFIAMEMVKGEPLRHLLKSEGRLEPSRAVMLMRRICAGVGAAHRLGIVHRDLKPENVMVVPPEEDGETETVKVLDFGIAKILDQEVTQLTQDGAVLGTAYYMPPEQWRSEEVDTRTDVYSLGAMLYEMLTGKFPFTGRTRDELMMKHLFEPPPSLTIDRGALPELEVVIERAMAKERDARPTDATELSRELRAAEEEMSRWCEAEAQRRRRQAEEKGRLKRETEETARRKREIDEAARRKRETKEIERGRVVERVPATAEGASSTARPTVIPLGIEMAAHPSMLPSDVVEQPKKSKLVLVMAGAALLVVIGIAWLMSSYINKRPISIELVRIPPGSFMMGSANGKNDEKPVRQVTINDGFYMGKYEVTQAQWQKVMGNNPSDFKGDNLPVENVSWDDAIAFIAKLNAQNDEYTYRLPSEAEWEYACRAGTTDDAVDNLDAMAWYVNNSGRQYLDAMEIFRTDQSNYGKRIHDNGGQTHPVGQKQANGFGLYDMQGNVWEWCQDWYHNSYTGGPTDGSAWLTGGEQKYRVLRGGSWSTVAPALRFALRSWVAPDLRSNPNNGFRVVAVART